MQNGNEKQFKVACRAPGVPQTCAWQTVLVGLNVDLNRLLQKDLNAGVLTHFWARSLKAERQRSSTVETLVFISFSSFLKDSTHFPLISEGPGSCSCLQRLHQVPPCLGEVPLCSRVQVGVWGRGFLLLTSWHFTCSSSIATTFYFEQCNSSQYCHQPLLVLWILSGKGEESV